MKMAGGAFSALAEAVDDTEVCDFVICFVSVQDFDFMPY